MASFSEKFGLGMTYQNPEVLKEPESLNENEGDKLFDLEEMSRDCRHYKEIETDFQNAGLSVLKVEKLKNLSLKKRYITERNLLKDRGKVDPNYKLNEKYLYHGTSISKASLCEEGLDPRMSKEGCFGKGIYFSDYPRKCVKYAQRGGSNGSVILVVRVMLGESKVYPNGKKDKTLRREPKKEQRCKGHHSYDSVQGCPRNHKEFVIYDSRKALVEYLVSFKIVNKQNVPRQKINYARNTSVSSDSDSDLSDSESADGRGKFSSSSDDDNSENESLSEDEETKGTPESRKWKEDYDKMVTASSKHLLKKKKEEFSKKTGVTDQYMIEHCLLKGDLNVKQAIQIYTNMPKEEEDKFQQLSMDSPDEVIDEDDEEERKPVPPTSDSAEWAHMSEEDREAVIQSLVSDFLHVTGLTQADEHFARTCLAKTNHNLDFAILAYYEELSCLSGGI